MLEGTQAESARYPLHSPARFNLKLRSKDSQLHSSCNRYYARQAHISTHTITFDGFGWFGAGMALKGK